MALNDRQIKSAKPKDKEYRLTDEKGMYLKVTKAGTKSFCLKFRINGKEKKLTIGQYPEMSLKEAREARDEARRMVHEGIDPSFHKQTEKAVNQLNSVNTFKAIAAEWFASHMSNKSDTHKARAKRMLEADLYPVIGNLPITDISAPILLTALRKIEQRNAITTAHRTKQVAGQVFRYAIATGRAERDPTPDLRGALRPKVPSHFAAITEPRQFGRLLVDIDRFEGTHVVRAGLKLASLFFCRPGELRAMKWRDVNFEEKRVEITAEKTHQQHIIPLSRQAIQILEEIHPLTGRSEYILPSARGFSRCMSENALRAALRSMGYDNDTMTPHGFRASARTLLDEVLGFRVEWIEQQLAHAVRDANGRAYNRTKHLKQRTEMMQRWADYLDQLRAEATHGNVITGAFCKA